MNQRTGEIVEYRPQGPAQDRMGDLVRAYQEGAGEEARRLPVLARPEAEQLDLPRERRGRSAAEVRMQRHNELMLEDYTKGREGSYKMDAGLAIERIAVSRGMAHARALQDLYLTAEPGSLEAIVGEELVGASIGRVKGGITAITEGFWQWILRKR